MDKFRPLLTFKLHVENTLRILLNWQLGKLSLDKLFNRRRFQMCFAIRRLLCKCETNLRQLFKYYIYFYNTTTKSWCYLDILYLILFFYCILCLTVLLWAWGAMQSTQPSQTRHSVPYCAVLLNLAHMTCHCAATEYTALFTQEISMNSCLYLSWKCVV